MAEQSFGETIWELQEKFRIQAKEFLERDLPRIQAFENEHAIALSKHGWYPCTRMMMDEFWGALANMRDGRTQEAEETMLAHYRDQFTPLRDELVRKHPNRALLLTEAFDAHEKKMYFSSTILFISQADGLCNGQLMTKERRQFLKSQKSSALTNVVLRTKSAIDDHSTQKSKYFSELNRHEVMHGLDPGYGSEINSLKALSLLSFIDGFVGNRNTWPHYGSAAAS